MKAKEEALHKLEAVIGEYGLKKTEVGLAIAGNRSFMEIMYDPKKSITTNTVDKINRYVLEVRGQLKLDLWLRVHYKPTLNVKPSRRASTGGRLVLIELKHPNGKARLSELQKKQIKRLTDAGIEAQVIDNKDGIDAIIKDITTPRDWQNKHKASDIISSAYRCR